MPAHDLIFVSLEPWDEIWRRNQFLCAAYAQRHPDQQILFVIPPLDISNTLRRGRLPFFHGARTWKVPGYPGITVTQPVKLAPNSIPIGRSINERMTRAHVAKVAKQIGLRRPVLWLNPHWAGHMAGRMGEAAVIYDITDDWTTLSQPRKSAEHVRRQDAELCRRADAIIVCSQRLLELKSQIAGNVHLIPNGVDAAHYRTVLDGNGKLPEEAAGWRRPVLGYTGTIHADRVDVALLAAIAREWKGSVVLIGPCHLRADDLERLNVANLVLPGAVPYMRLPEFMRAFDVCIVPHRVTPFTESLNPIKLWEYLATGKPIVSTDVAGFRDYPQLVRIATGAGQFVAAASAAMSEDASLANLRRDEAARHSWQSRLDLVEAVIAEANARSTGSKTSDAVEAVHAG